VSDRPHLSLTNDFQPCCKAKAHPVFGLEVSPIMKNKILGSRVDPISYAQAIKQIIAWAEHHESRYVCVANVHVLMEAYDSLEFQNVVNAADLVTPDGMPLVWMLHRLGYPQQERVYGPELTLKLLEAVATQEIAIGFYGGTVETLEQLTALFKKKYPNLKIAYSYSPPFRSMTVEEDEAVIQTINTSGTKILFIGLGCPKQERWMAMHRGKIQAVMLGVGAAFDFHAGTKRQAPYWMQSNGIEWLFRFSQEPSRLWRRYLNHNPRFMILAILQLTGIMHF
jgi:N-acetylglucosaminyldiphosphoundecaprenol N-acetyl-beta-D-mannosaminyltransferase